MVEEAGAAPPQARPTNNTIPTSPPRDLVTYSGHPNRINLSPDVPTSIDVRIRSGEVRYTSDPHAGRTAGLWRANWDLVPEKISPLALVRIEIGERGGIEVDMIHPSTGDHYPFEGNIEEIVDAVHLAGSRLGCRVERQRVFWALYEMVAWARRQAAAREDVE